MAEVTERDWKLAFDLQGYDANTAMRDAGAQLVAAYREECVAEERAAREKAEQERDEEHDRRMETVAMCTHLEARLRAVIEAADRLTFFAPSRQAEAENIAAYRKVRDASPKPKASKQACADFRPG